MILHPTVFQSYQDVGMLMMKGCVKIGGSFMIEKISPQAGIDLSLLDQ